MSQISASHWTTATCTVNKESAVYHSHNVQNVSFWLKSRLLQGNSQDPGATAPKTPHSALGAELWFPSIPFGPCFSLGGVLMFQWFCPGVCCPHRVQKEPGGKEAALFPCKDIRMRPQLPCDLPIYQELRQTREDMRRAGVQLLHCGGQAPTCSVNCPHCLCLLVEPWAPGGHLNGSECACDSYGSNQNKVAFPAGSPAWGMWAGEGATCWERPII